MFIDLNFSPDVQHNARWHVCFRSLSKFEESYQPTRTTLTCHMLHTPYSVTFPSSLLPSCHHVIHVYNAYMADVVDHYTTCTHCLPVTTPAEVFSMTLFYTSHGTAQSITAHTKLASQPLRPACHILSYSEAPPPHAALTSDDTITPPRGLLWRSLHANGGWRVVCYWGMGVVLLYPAVTVTGPTTVTHP